MRAGARLREALDLSSHVEEIKSFEKLLDADERWAYFATVNRETGEKAPYSLRDRYRSIEGAELLSSVPEEVRSEFNIARMLCVYAWLYYPFHSMAELKAFATVELALRLRFPQTRANGLKRLLTRAVKEGVLKDRGFSNVEVDQQDPQRYSRMLPDLIPDLRNALAHGEVQLHPGSAFTVNNCSEIINQLFPKDREV